MSNLSDRMKSYEKDFRTKLPDRFPVIMRLDGRTFGTFTRGCKKPFDDTLIHAMNECATILCTEIQGAQIAYVASDEISIFIHNYKRFDSQAWFGNQVQKMCSVAASIASVAMSFESMKIFGAYKLAHFDARVFIVPETDVVNYFLFRQQDWTRNSVQMLARSYYSQNQCHGQNNSALQDMIHDKGDNWNDLATHLKRGRCIVKESYESPNTDGWYGLPNDVAMRSRWVVDNKIPIFSQDRDYIDKYLELEEE